MIVDDAIVPEQEKKVAKRPPPPIYRKKHSFVIFQGVATALVCLPLLAPMQ